jgi:NAD(P)H-dependent flavin oxidoreductase YrpB (nitropropane dioxygenase family)
MIYTCLDQQGNFMVQAVFKSLHPILLANMNKGTVLELALAVHQAGGYASLCSWTYGDNLNLMEQDIKSFVQITGSSLVNLSFSSSLISNPKKVLELVKTYEIPVIEAIYGGYTSPLNWWDMDPTELDQRLISALGPIHEHGTKIFKRIYDPHTAEQQSKHFIDGFMIKGSDSAGLSNPNHTVQELFLIQKDLTPNAYLVPYGGVGTGAQVKEYLELGAEIVAVGTLFAASSESLVKQQTKQAMIAASSQSLETFSTPKGMPIEANGGVIDRLDLGITSDKRRQLALKFDPYTEPDDSNHTGSLISGIWKKNTTQGHVFAGHSIDHVTAIESCENIIRRLTLNH